MTDRKQAAEWFAKRAKDTPMPATKAMFEMAADALSTVDAVSVVRCKNCIYCKFNSSAEIHKCDRRGYFTETVAEEGYCSYGERKVSE